MDFTLPHNNSIYGGQLVAEIEQATGIDLSDGYMFVAPNIVRVRDGLVVDREVEIKAIIDAHMPNPLYFPEDRMRQAEQSAEDDAATIPGWATWTKAEAAAWYDEHVTNLVDAIPDVDGLTPTTFQNKAQTIVAQMQDIAVAQTTVIHNLARMVLAMRNKLWPNLEGSE